MCFIVYMWELLSTVEPKTVFSFIFRLPFLLRPIRICILLGVLITIYTKKRCRRTGTFVALWDNQHIHTLDEIFTTEHRFDTNDKKVYAAIVQGVFNWKQLVKSLDYFYRTSIFTFRTLLCTDLNDEKTLPSQLSAVAQVHIQRRGDDTTTATAENAKTIRFGWSKKVYSSDAADFDCGCGLGAFSHTDDSN